MPTVLCLKAFQTIEWATIVNASETKLQQIIEGEKQYVVPLFQRAYSWNDKEWKTLWDDLIDLYEQDSPRAHFIGSIVTIPTTSVPEGVAKYLLIDGQQRLTTIFVLMAVLRDRINGEELAEEIHNTLLVNPYKKGNDKLKLLPTQFDRNAFLVLIEGNTNAENGTQIIKAYKYFERQFKKNNLDIAKFKKIVTGYLSLVSIVLDPNDNPHLVFESLNAKGRPLTQSDLIRNYFFMRIHVDQQDEKYSRFWQPMQSALDENLTEYIRHFLMRRGVKVNVSDIYLTLKDQVRIDNAIEYLQELARFAKYYEKLLSPEKEDDPIIRLGLTRLNRIEVTVAYPFLLNVYDEYQANRITVNQFADILKVLENFMIRRFICNVPSNALNKIFPSLYIQIFEKNSDDFVAAMKSILQSKGYPRDYEFRDRIKDVKLYGAGDRLIKTKLILESIEESYGHKESVSFEKAAITIEHILPQTPTDWWKNHLGDDWEMTHELWLHTIGNLTLTGYNSELSNDDFDTKRQKLSESHLEINRYFDGVTTWRVEDIKNRSDQLSELALKVWPYFGEDKSAQNQMGVTGTKPVGLWILGQKFYVDTWKEVLIRTLGVIAELAPDKFEQIEQRYPRFVGKDKNNFRRSNELPNGVFVEVNLSADSIQKFCYQAIETVGLTSDDWRVGTR